MKKTVLTYGLISGAISAVLMWVTLPFMKDIESDKSLIVGYTTIVLAVLLIFFGVRSYRDNVASGRLTFGRAVAVGILITLISNTCYVVSWQVLYYNFMPDYLDKYFTREIEKAKASGQTQEKIEKTIRDTEEFREMVKNPAVHIAMTYAEVFPVGLVVTLISAAILRGKTAPQET